MNHSMRRGGSLRKQELKQTPTMSFTNLHVSKYIYLSATYFLLYFIFLLQPICITDKILYFYSTILTAKLLLPCRLKNWFTL